MGLREGGGSHSESGTLDTPVRKSVPVLSAIPDTSPLPNMAV